MFTERDAFDDMTLKKRWHCDETQEAYDLELPIILKRKSDLLVLDENKSSGRDDCK